MVFVQAGRIKITFKQTILVGLLLALVNGSTGFAADDDIRLAVPTAMIETGFTKHILPRFRFKHRITLNAVEEGSEADLALLSGSTDGQPIFQSVDGDVFSLVQIASTEPVSDAAQKFTDWLKSDPGIAALEGFPADGPAQYAALGQTVAVAEKAEISGDAHEGSRLAIVHCGRCHVIDERNRMGGIGSTPSFAALRARPGWNDLFEAFWVHNPHPSFTQVEGVTPPFDPSRPVHIAPVEITLEEIEAITAFASTIQPKELGRPVQAN